jgi:hypothetical protein
MERIDLVTALAKVVGFTWPAAMVFGSAALAIAWFMWLNQQANAHTAR